MPPTNPGPTGPEPARPEPRTAAAGPDLTDTHPAAPAPTTADDPAAAMVVGQRYHLRYRSSAQRRDRGAVMVYLGSVDGPDGDALLFDASPAAGTQHMPRAWIRAVQTVPAGTPAYLNKIER